MEPHCALMFTMKYIYSSQINMQMHQTTIMLFPSYYATDKANKMHINYN